METDMMTLEQLKSVISDAEQEATRASKNYLRDVLGGRDQFPCGFAWVNIIGFNGQRITGNTKMGKLLKQVGVTQNYGDRKFQAWCPGRIGCQNVGVHERGASTFAHKLQLAGFDVEMGSKLD